MSEITPFERAARALHIIYTEDKARCGVKDMPTWEELGRDGEFYFKNQACAVLMAIREPSGIMMVLGSSYTACDYDSAKSCWQAMIDAALANTDESAKVGPTNSEIVGLIENKAS